ncbi:MAG: hypothetical protein ACKVZ0_06585 [Gemmatimonadales bacterium]
MDKYWVKIALGAAVVFGVGMTGVTLAKKGVHELKTAALGPVPAVLAALRSELLNFRLDGRRIGSVKRIDVSNEGEWTPKSVQIRVALAEEIDGLEECQLATDRWGRRHEDARFRCVTDEDITDEELVQVGEVRFEPGDLVRPLYATERDVRRINRSAIRGLKGSLHSEDGNAVTGEASFDVEDRRGHREKGTVRLDASDGGALIEIRDEQGREIFKLRANEQGVSLNANDKRGNALLRLLAGEAGVSMKIDAEKEPN